MSAEAALLGVLTPSLPVSSPGRPSVRVWVPPCSSCKDTVILD